MNHVYREQQRHSTTRRLLLSIGVMLLMSCWLVSSVRVYDSVVDFWSSVRFVCGVQVFEVSVRGDWRDGGMQGFLCGVE